MSWRSAPSVSFMYNLPPVTCLLIIVWSYVLNLLTYIPMVSLIFYSWFCFLEQGEVVLFFFYFISVFQTEALSSCMYTGQTSLLFPCQLKSSALSHFLSCLNRPSAAPAPPPWGTTKCTTLPSGVVLVGININRVFVSAGASGSPQVE